MGKTEFQPSLCLVLALSACTSPKPPKPTVAEAPPVSKGSMEEIFGKAVHDPFRWLEDVKDPEVQSWMDAQNQLARKHLAELPGREALQARLKALTYVDSVSVPVLRGDRRFFVRQPKDAEKGLLYVKVGKAEPSVLIDMNTLSEDGSTSLGVWVPSKDGKKLAYALKPNNMDEATLYVMDVDTRAISEIDVIPGAKYAEPQWTADGNGFFYTWLPEEGSVPTAERPGYSEVRFHRLGATAADDTVIHPKLGDPTRFIWPEISSDGRYLFINIWRGWSENDLFVRRFADGEKPEDATFSLERGWKVLAQAKKARFEVRTYKDTLFISSNEGAPRLQIFAVDGKDPAPAKWKLIIKEDKDAVIEHFGVAGGKLLVAYMRNAASELGLFAPDGKRIRPVKLPAVGSLTGLSGESTNDTFYYGFSAFLHPGEIYESSIKSGKSTVFAKIEVPVKPEDFETEQVFYHSKDGTRVSMFIVKKKGLEKNGALPTLLYGYGGFNISLTPKFLGRLIPWLEDDGVYAVPNLRGGGEYGEAWHQAGMMHNKQNVFDDFIAAAEYLIKEKYTRPDKLAIAGRSNGGLLVGAAMTQRPDLFRAVICGVPLLDMVRYHLFGSGKTWIPEYGDPDKAEDFEVLFAYSPYHRVTDGADYPSLLMASADSDDRVDPMHARKFVARLQAAAKDQRPRLLRIEKNSGHGGADLRRSAVEQGVDELTFLWDQVGVKP